MYLYVPIPVVLLLFVIMGRELNMDTQRQNFWKEAIEKECSVRVAWMDRNRGDVPYRDTKSVQEKRNAALVEKVKGSIPKRPEKSVTLPSINGTKNESPTNNHLTTEKRKPRADLCLTEMRPVSPSVRQLLYRGFTKEGKGRYQYLQARTAKKPEDKYEYPLTSSWDIGWHLDDVTTKFQGPMYARSRIVRDTFFRRNGILYIS